MADIDVLIVHLGIATTALDDAEGAAERMAFDIAALRELAACRECETVPDGPGLGWLPGLCPGCQAAEIAANA